MGSIDLEFLCSVSYVGAKNSPEYSCNSTQGYTIGEGNSHVVIGLDSGGKGCFKKYTNAGKYQSASPNQNFGHGNGCTYYDGCYYVAIGSKESASNMIYRYNKKFEKTGEYHCSGESEAEKYYVSSITHMTGDYYILGSGAKAYVAKRYGGEVDGYGQGAFRVYSTLDLTDSSIDTTSLVPQSLYYDEKEKMLYRVFSYSNNNIILKNGIAKYSLSGGNSPSYNTATLQGVYINERSDIPFFEMESMSSDSNGWKYVATNAKYKGGGEKNNCDAIFKITLR